MNRLDNLPSKKILSLFMTCGFPNLTYSKKIFQEILSHQPDIIEFGLPFSDPMADGPVIQESSKLALNAKITTKQSLSLIKQLRKESNQTSFVIMCYLNTVQKYGVKKFISDIKGVVDGIILVDLPFEEENETKKLLDQNNVHLIKGNSNKVLKKIDMSKIDYVFLDGGHEYDTVFSDLTCCYEVINNNGVVLCDDYNLSQAPGVKKAIDDFVKEKKINCSIICDGRFAKIEKN